MKTFNKLEQADNCERLAHILEHINPALYDHSLYQGKSELCGTIACALGWACQFGVGGLSYSFVGLPQIDDDESLSDSPSCAEHVFGDGTYNTIFGVARHAYVDVMPFRDTGDQGHSDSINLLRAQAAQLREEFTTENL